MIPCNICTRHHYGCLECLRNMWKMDQLENFPQLLLDDIDTKCPHCTGYVNPFQMKPAPTIDRLTRDIFYRCKNNGCDWFCDRCTPADVMATHERECR